MKIDLRLVAAGIVLAGVVATLLWLRSGPNIDLATRLVSDDPAESEVARAQLLKGEPTHIAALRSILKSDVSDWQGEARVLAALDVVTELGNAAHGTLDELLALAGSQTTHVRDVAARALPAIGATAEQAVPVLTNGLTPDASVPVLRALSEYKEAAEPAVPAMIEIMKNQELDAEVRWNAARTLGKAREGGVAAIPELVTHLTDREPTVREHAAEALGDIGPAAKATAPDLIAVLGDEYVKVRRDAVRSLGQIDADPETAIPAIKPLLKDPEEIVRDAAKVTLETLQKGA